MIAAIWNRVNTKRLWMTTFTVFAFIFLSDGLIHGWYLNQTYHETPNLWRSEMEMRQFVNWLVAGQFLISFFLSFIFTKGYENKGWQEGARYGFLIGLFAASNQFITYAVTPLPWNIFWAWIWTGLVQCTLAGIVASLVYKNR